MICERLLDQKLELPINRIQANLLWSTSQSALSIKRSQIDRSGQMKRLYRSRTNRIIAGVCGGIAEYTNIDPTVVRLLWLLVSLIWGAGIVAYIIALIIIPEEP